MFIIVISIVSVAKGFFEIPFFVKLNLFLFQNRKNIVCHLPEVGLNNYSMKLDTTNDVHIYASPKAYRGKVKSNNLKGHKQC